MPHVLTRTRAGVGGGILAVLLLACFGAQFARKRPLALWHTPEDR